jgi:hypothetical protein
LTDHIDCVRDEVARLADAKAHQLHYTRAVEDTLQLMFNQ